MAKITLSGMMIVVSGNPVDGLYFFGPFNNSEEAIEWAEQSREGEWWIAPLAATEHVTRVRKMPNMCRR